MAEDEGESCDRFGELEKRGKYRRELTRNKWKKGKKRLRHREGLADTFVMMPVDVSVWFSPAQLSSPGTEKSNGWMDHPGCVWQSRRGRQTWRSGDRGGGEGVLGPISPKHWGGW